MVLTHAKQEESLVHLLFLERASTHNAPDSASEDGGDDKYGCPLWNYSYGDPLFEEVKEELEEDEAEERDTFYENDTAWTPSPPKDGWPDETTEDEQTPGPIRMPDTQLVGGTQPGARLVLRPADPTTPNTRPPTPPKVPAFRHTKSQKPAAKKDAVPGKMHARSLASRNLYLAAKDALLDAPKIVAFVDDKSGKAMFTVCKANMGPKPPTCPPPPPRPDWLPKPPSPSVGVPVMVPPQGPRPDDKTLPWDAPDRIPIPKLLPAAARAQRAGDSAASASSGSGNTVSVPPWARERVFSLV